MRIGIRAGVRIKGTGLFYKKGAAELNVNFGKLNDVLNSFPNARVLVIGDIMMDEYIWGKVSRISPEAPVPVVNVTKETLLLGGAANVVNNIRSLGGKVYLAGVIGPDDMGRKVIRDLRSKEIDTDGVIVEHDRPTTVKTRIVAHSQQMVRYDRESKGLIAPDSIQKIISYLNSILNAIDAVVISDYSKGVISGQLLKEVLKAAGGKTIVVDPKMGNFPFYTGITAMTPNHHEAAEGAGITISNENDVITAGRILLEKLKCKSILITRGEEGMSLFEANGDVTHIPTVAKEIYDVTGAGDTVISAFTLALAAGAGFKEAAYLSNYAAGIVVGKVGTAAVTADELREVIKES
ncbi:MAG TPA: D-glycero-beta-D-manno-heptose-7-phosphate kinase [Thermodesulfobacteriota bacterium]|nr:D-glycero-beta-D-manno-heptose-7-phosphate kinase [Thermodesulfobacteriota bacterium]